MPARTMKRFPENLRRWTSPQGEDPGYGSHRARPLPSALKLNFDDLAEALEALAKRIATPKCVV